MDDLLREDERVSKIVEERYVMVPIDALARQNRALRDRYMSHLHGFPYLVIMNGDGTPHATLEKNTLRGGSETTLNSTLLVEFLEEHVGSNAAP
jgi:hypothetical protein